MRLKLLTTQTTPRKKVKVNNQDREVNDVDRTLRFAETPMLAANQSDATATILVPADLPQIAYDIAIEAELLAADNKTAIASATTAARRMAASRANLAGVGHHQSDRSTSRAGTDRQVDRQDQPLGRLCTAGGRRARRLAQRHYAAARSSCRETRSEFELQRRVSLRHAGGDLPGVKLTGASQVDAEEPELDLRTNEIPLAVKVVPGEKPPVEKPLAIFEDQAEFVANLNQGGGQASLFVDEKYSGAASIKVTPDQRFNPALPGLGLKIRENPGPGEFRYLQFAWKKQGGTSICLQLNHDGQWGPAGDKPAKFRYHAGPGPECFGASTVVDANLPGGFAAGDARPVRRFRRVHAHRHRAVADGWRVRAIRPHLPGHHAARLRPGEAVRIRRRGERAVPRSISPFAAGHEAVAGAAHARENARARGVFLEILAQVDDEIVDRARGRHMRQAPDVFE